MNKKNVPSSINSHKKRQPSSNLVKFATIASLLASSVFSNNLYSQNSQTGNSIPVNLQKKNTLDLVEKNDSIEHEKIIIKNVKDILTQYGEEKGMEMINNHFVIEVNKLRESLQASPLQVSYEVMLSSQKQAEFLYNSGKFQHMLGAQLLPKRLEKENIIFYTCGENLAEGQINIMQLIQDWLLSKIHTANLINPKFKKIGLGYEGGKRVYIAIG